MKHNLFALIAPITEYHKGGGAPPQPEKPDYNAQARAQMDIMRQQAAMDQQASDRKAAQDKADHEEAVSKSSARVGNAYNAATGSGDSRLTAMGLDPASGLGMELRKLYTSSLDRNRAGAPEVVTDANSLFGPSLFDDAANILTGTQRQKLNKSLNGFMGDGFADEAFSDTADDSILQSILGTQKGASKKILDDALARGQINDQGYNAGLGELENEYKGGLAKANQTGLGVISGYRKGLNDFAGQAHTKVDNYALGDDFNVDNYKTRLNSKVQGYQSGLEGDILSAIGDTNYFNTDTLLGKAGNASGVVNGGNSSGSALSGLVGSGAGSTSLLQKSATGGSSNTDGGDSKNKDF